MAIDLYKNRCAVYEGEKPYIFISYSHRDIEKVVKLIRQLQSLGFRIWYDSGVPAGAEWPEEIATHLKNSGCVLSLLSANAAKSRHFKEEFNYAYHLKQPILVAYLEDCELTPGIEMRVVSQQCIKCEHCEDDDDLLTEIARAKILLPCLGEKPDVKLETPALKPENKTSKAEIAELRAKAENGDAQAQFLLAEEYKRGINVARDYSEAVRWYQLSAAQGNSDAQNGLAIRYMIGNEVDRDINKAIELYRLSAMQNNPKAQWNLGVVYENGAGVPQDWEEAVRWYLKAAEQGHDYAQEKIADCYRKGLGVPMDEAEAARWQKLYDENRKK